MVRKPAVSGSFYPNNKQKIIELFDYYNDYIYEENAPKKQLIDPSGIIVPHAGYVFSGKTAFKAYKKIYHHGDIRRVFLLGPNHTGLGKHVSVYNKGAWSSPLGEVNICEETSEQLLNYGIFEADVLAHYKEHSLEVQLPFLQYFYNNDFKIIPIIIKDQSEKNTKIIGGVLSEIITEGDLVVASTDLNHFDNQDISLEKDNYIIDAIKELNSKKMYEYLKKYDISMCGYGPVNAIINCGFNKIEILEHLTSGDIIMQYDSVVGYLSAYLYN